MIFFDEKKQPFGFEIPNAIASIDDETWGKYAATDKWDIVEGEFIDVSQSPEYLEQQAEIREKAFNADFFEIPNVGWYRKQPKGYSSAIESLNTVFNIFKDTGVPADVLIFYAAPDFSDETQCTNEWLIEHQFKNTVMTAAEFALFYKTAIMAWNNQEHQ